MGQLLASLRLQRHVVRVRQPEVVVEAMSGRQKLRLVSEMPFADAHRRVVLRLQQLGDGVLRRVEAVGITGITAALVYTLRVAAGHHLRPRGHAHRRSIERGQLHPLPPHAVELRRAVLRRAKRPDVRVAQVVN